jgi:hypothetical protein
MKGTIDLTEDKVRFSIEMPRFDMLDGTATNTIQRYEKCEHNGEYNLVVADPQLGKNHLTTTGIKAAMRT